MAKLYYALALLLHASHLHNSSKPNSKHTITKLATQLLESKNN